jgi:hypothetical protein
MVQAVRLVGASDIQLMVRPVLGETRGGGAGDAQSRAIVGSAFGEVNRGPAHTRSLAPVIRIA